MDSLWEVHYKLLVLQFLIHRVWHGQVLSMVYCCCFKCVPVSAQVYMWGDSWWKTCSMPQFKTYARNQSITPCDICGTGGGCCQREIKMWTSLQGPGLVFWFGMMIGIYVQTRLNRACPHLFVAGRGLMHARPSWFVYWLQQNVTLKSASSRWD